MQFWGPRLLPANVSVFSWALEPFLSSILTHGSDSAYPPTRSKAFFPTNLSASWSSSASDKVVHDALVQSAAQLSRVAEMSGQQVQHASRYPNYAIFDTPLEKIYGGNLERLRQLKLLFDPNNVMGLAGGFKF